MSELQTVAQQISNLVTCAESTAVQARTHSKKIDEMLALAHHLMKETNRQEHRELIARLTVSKAKLDCATDCLIIASKFGSDWLKGHIASNESGMSAVKKCASFIKTVVGVAATAIASAIPATTDTPPQQHIDALSKTEVVRSIEYSNDDISKQEKLARDYLKLKEQQKSEKGEEIPDPSVPAGAGGNSPESDPPYRIFEDENGMPIVEVYVEGASYQHRTIPGTPGVVNVKLDAQGKPSGNSSELSKNLWKSFDAVPSESYEFPHNLPHKAKGHQAQHIIPVELYNHPALQKIGMDMNDASNGIFLPEPDSRGHALTTHKGYHAVYNNICKEYLDKIYEKHGTNASIEALEADIARFQHTLRTILEAGMPIYLRKPNADKLDVGERGGGATEELLRRTINREFQI